MGGFSRSLLIVLISIASVSCTEMRQMHLTRVADMDRNDTDVSDNCSNLLECALQCLGEQCTGRAENTDIALPGGRWNIFQPSSTKSPWLTFLRRQDGSVDFYRPWADYRAGFGDPAGEMWLGLEALHLMTSHHQSRMRVEVGDWDGNMVHTEYALFRVGPESDGYRLEIAGYDAAVSTAGDSMMTSHIVPSFASNNGMKFSTTDVDNDGDHYACTAIEHGCWWYNSCTASNPTGEYLTNAQPGNGINWYTVHTNWYKYKTIEMMFCSACN